MFFIGLIKEIRKLGIEIQSWEQIFNSIIRIPLINEIENMI